MGHASRGCLQLEALEDRMLLASGLVAAYGFAEGSGGTTVDTSGNGNTGTLSNASWVQGKYGGGLKFTGATNSFVSIPDAPSLDLTSTLTLEAWVNPSSLNSPDAGWCAAVAKDHPNSANDISYALYAAAGTNTPPSEHLLTGSSDVGVAATTKLTLNTWTFLAATYDGASMKIYVNGTLIKTKAQTGSIVEVNAPLKIGGDWSGEMFTGVIDEVRVYNAALTQTQVQSDMNTPIASLTLSPGVLPADTLNVPYNQTITASGGTGTKNLVLSNVQNAIPGLSVPSSGTNTLTISGTPTATGTETFTVTATDQAGGTTHTNYSITVNAAPTLNPASLPASTQGVSYNQAITASNGTGSVSLAVTNIQNALPGLVIPGGGTNTLAISGTPTASGTTTFTVTPTDSLGGQGTAVTYSIVIHAPISFAPPSLPAAVVGSLYNRTITASNGTGNISLVVSNVVGAIAGITIPSTGTNALTIQGTPTATGTITFTLNATDAVGASATPVNYTLTANVGLALSPSSLPADTIGVPYNQTITTSNGTGTVNLVVSNVQNAIAGLSVPNSGTTTLTISGTPTAAGTETFTVSATDQAGGTATTNYTITINPAVALNPNTLPVATVNVVYNQTITASNGTGSKNLVVGNVQGAIAGLTVPSSGTNTLTITGTPTAAGTETFTVTATDQVGGTTSSNYSVTVNPAVVVSPTTLSTATRNNAYTVTLAATGGSGAGYTFAETGALPTGLTLTGGGVLSGTPTQAGSFPITVTATDSNAAAGNRQYTLTVNPAVVVSPTILGNATVNSPYSVTFAASGGSGAGYTYAESGTLPSGLTFTTAGSLSGTPTQVGTFTITVTATDSIGGTGSVADTLTVLTAGPPSVSITSPTSGSTLAGVITISANASASVGISGVQFAIDGTNVGAAVTTAPYGISWDSTTRPDGNHTITATATDTSGNTASSSVTVQLVNGGVFGSVTSMPMVAINMVLMHNGKLLLWQDDSQTPQVFDPLAGTFTNIPENFGDDIFCSGNGVLPDGRILVPGGHDPTGVGTTLSVIFDPSTNSWVNLPPMHYARWYPSVTPLPDGRMLITGGGNATSFTTYVPYPEIYDPVANTWTVLTGADLAMPSYTHDFVLSNGQVVSTGASEVTVPTRLLDWTGTGSWSTVDPNVTDGASSVMYRQNLIMKEGTAADSGTIGSAAPTTYVLDMNQSNPHWVQTASMHFARATNTNLVTLPDGNVMVFGGATDTSGQINANAVLPTEEWNPATQTWKVMASLGVPRMYHSTAVLLPDGRVLTSGQGRDAGVTDELNYQIYSPPYLFQGARPSITSVSNGVLQYGSNFTVTTPDAAGITSVVLVRPGSATHGFNFDQRFVPLTFSQGTGSLSVQAPANGNLAAPGYYMLFAVNSKGVPSMASWVRLPAPWEDNQPPSAPANLTASGAVGSVALTWGASTDNLAVTQYNIYRSTVSGFTPSGGNLIGTSATTSYTDYVAAGTYYYLVAAQDAAGNVSAPSNQASGISAADTIPPTVSMTAPTSGTIVSGTIAVAAAAGDNVAVASVQFVLDGANYGAPITTAPYSFSWNSATVANGPHSWLAIAKDVSGNTTTSATDSFTVTNTSLPGEVASYSLDEGTGATVNDSSTNNNSGTVSNAAWTAGHFGNALKFTGAANSMVTINNSSSLALTNGLTLEAWVNPSTLASIDSGWVAAVAKDHLNSGNDIAYALYAANGTGTPPALHLLIGTNDVGLQGTSLLPLNTWTFLTGTYDGSTMRLYVNGTLVASKTQTGNIVTTTDPLHIGGDWSGEMFTGMIDNVRIYNRALTVSDIASDMNTPISARPLHAQNAPAGGGGEMLTPALLAGVVEQAITRWAAAGISADRLQVLHDVHLEVRDLPSPYLGLTSGNQIWISRNAQGYGWFTNPGDDPAFATGQVHGMDLLTTVVHEFGHVLNLERDDGISAMAEWLPPATRRDPVAPTDAIPFAAGLPQSAHTEPAGTDLVGSSSDWLWAVGQEHEDHFYLLAALLDVARPSIKSDGGRGQFSLSRLFQRSLHAPWQFWPTIIDEYEQPQQGDKIVR